MSRVNPLQELKRFGVSVWYDNISRRLLESGELKRLICADGISGLTSNPAIFANALAAAHDYDEAVRRLLATNADPAALFEALAVEDIRAAADLLKDVYVDTRGRDGFVSLELPPELAQNPAASHEQALRLHRLVDRPNVMIKIPGTAAALPAITETIADGIPVNVTLLFAQERYAKVIEAYLQGLELRAARGKDLAQAACVASFFVSRLDTAVDQTLESLKAAGGNAAKEASELLGKAAVANAKLAYQIYRREFSGERFARLKSRGARPQRLLWASTGTKNPNYKDTLYVTELIGPDTINTMPPATIDAFRDHGACRPSLESDLPAARAVWERLQALGVDLAKITRLLEDEGLLAFERSTASILETVAAKKISVLAKEDATEAGLSALRQARFSERLWAKDASLWKKDKEHQKIIRNSLGWLTLPDAMAAGLGPVRSFAAEVRRDGFTHALVLGMGGSSLSCEVLRRCFDRATGHPALEVLDSTNPGTVAAMAGRIRPDRTLFIVSSKSGSTIEPNCLLEYFFALVSRSAGAQAGRQFVAITDPGTSLEKLAVSRKFRKVFINPTDIGGRFSALSLFGLVPAAVMGVDCPRLLGTARDCARLCAATMETAENPGLRLGAAIGRHALQGRDKLTLSLTPALEPLGLWIEQLIAESTGKEGRGILPVHGEPLAAAESYGPDRIFVRIALRGQPEREVEERLGALERAGHPVIRFSLQDVYDLGAQFFLWEIATAAAGFLLGVNPFDQPDVQKAKDQTKRLLCGLDGGALPRETANLRAGGLAAYADSALIGGLGAHAGLDLPLRKVLAAHLGRLKPGDYCVIVAYAHADDDTRHTLESLQRNIRRMTTAPVTVEYGPRYLHSTGQLYKGGPSSGLFLELLTQDAASLPIPGEAFNFGVLHQAQARGDFATMLASGRRILRLDLGPATGDSLRALANASAEPSACPS